MDERQIAYQNGVSAGAYSMLRGAKMLLETKGVDDALAEINGMLEEVVASLPEEFVNDIEQVVTGDEN